MKQILYLCGQLPWPLDNGQKIVSFNDLRYLSSVFQVDVLSYIDPINLPKQAELLASLKTELPNVHFLPPVVHRILSGNSIGKKASALMRGMMRALPYVVGKYRNSKYLKMIQGRLASQTYDVLYIDHIHPSYALNELPSETLCQVKLVYRAHDIFSETLSAYAKELGGHPTSWAVKLDAWVCRQYERRIWKRVDAILPVTRRLAELISKDLPALKSKMLFFPVLFDPQAYVPHIRPTAQRVLYIGTVHFPPNLQGLKWFLDRCWPLVLAQFPDAKFDIVGRGGNELLPVHDSVRIHNYLEDLSAAFEGADVFVVPLFSGSGIRLKILDALKHGVPVVTTGAGYAGLEIIEGTHVLVADEPQSFAERICDLLNSEAMRTCLARNGQDYIEANHSRLHAEQMVAKIYEMVEA